MLSSLLIANRGEIARRIIRTARRMGVRTVAVYTEADRTWPHWREADAAILIGEGPAGESYLSAERIIGAAREAGVEAVHPGYGFLSENAAFAEACTAAGLLFVGPPAAAIRAMGAKSEAKAIMARTGVPVVPGYGGERQDPDFLRQKAYEIGYPVLIKAVAGGGGRGMRRVGRVLEFEGMLTAAKREALTAFGDDRVLIERFVEKARHVEVQVFADNHGNAVHLFERDCSVQRRHQKVMEEAPAPGLPDGLRSKLGKAAIEAALAIGYRGAGTVEFIVDAAAAPRTNDFFFLEMNTRLQVEHPVTEAVTGIDLVEWQLLVVAGETLPLRQDEIRLKGHAIEARLYAEDPAEGFRPSTGRLWAASFASVEGIRVDTGAEEGSVVTPFYDAMLAKIIASGDDRGEALERLAAALGRVRVAGPKTNLAFLTAVARHPDFIVGGVDTGFVDRELRRLTGSPLKPTLAADAIAAWANQRAKRFGAGGRGAWARIDGFAPGGLKRRSSLAVMIDGHGMTAEITWSEDGAKVVALDGEPVAHGAEVIWAEQEALVLQDGRQLHVSFPDPLARDPAAALAGGEIRVPMPGRVVDIAVAEGTYVRKGDPLFTLEAMKMEHVVIAPLSGTVRAVRITPIQQVEQGSVALMIDAEGAVE
jgi:3-methylcrotonyl-CoA carboxylase alpha subunit